VRQIAQWGGLKYLAVHLGGLAVTRSVLAIAEYRKAVALREWWAERECYDEAGQND
jgi:hypothetical protein